MAFGLSRKLCIAGFSTAMVAAAVVVPTVASAAPNNPPGPTPTIASVQKRLGTLALQNDQLVEAYNQANIAYGAARVAAHKAAADYATAEHQLAVAREQLSVSAAAQYEGGAFSSTGALLSSDSGSSYLDQLDTLSMLSAHNAQIVSSFAATQAQTQAAKRRADAMLARASRTRAKVVEERTQTSQQIDKYKKLLASLNAAQRAAWLRMHSPSVSSATVNQIALHPTAAASGAARKAVDFALAQVGKPYVFGAAGPSSYDCSGLTMAAWAAAGVSLPHSAADQYNYGHHVSASQLQPGDLLFYYQPIGHVTIYVGDGMMASAPEPGQNVQIVPVSDFTSDFVGATRLVG